MRNLTAGLTALSVFVSGAGVAFSAEAQGPLAPGKPAGIAKAQAADEDNTLLYILGLGAIGAGIAILASNGSSKAVATSTAGGGTTTTTTT
jgi:hypothetical protein